MQNSEKNQKILKLISEAEIITADEKYMDAYLKWDEVVTELDVTIQQTKASRMIAKGAGILGGVVTGGIGLEDVFLVPLISKGLMKVFGIDLKFFLEKLEYSLIKRQYCMQESDDTILISDYHKEMTYFCWCYEIANEVNDDGKLKMLLNLINPFEDNESMKHKKSVLELYDLIEKNISESRNHNRFKIDKLNAYLYNYLKKSNKKNNDLFKILSTTLQKK